MQSRAAFLMAMAPLCAALLCATLGLMTTGGSALAEDAKQEKPAAEKPADPPAQPPEKPAEPQESTYTEADDYTGTMETIGLNWRLVGKAIRNKDAAALKTAADKIRFHAGKATGKDAKKERREAKDYAGWMSDMESGARKLRQLAEAKQVDWDAAGKQKDTLKQSCDSCHDKYQEKKEQR